LADTSYGRLAGTGRINLRDERLDLRMETDLRLPIPGANFLRLRAGIPVGGTLSAPQADLSGIAPEALAGQAGALLRTPLDLLDGLLGVFGAAPGTVPGSGGLASCATALAEPSQRRFAAPTGAAPRETGNDNAIREILRGLVVR
jgi:hypothetical protein